MASYLSVICRCCGHEQSIKVHEKEPEPAVIAAIDFGTSSSGYAFGFTKTGSDRITLSDIQLNKWQLESASSSTDKAPTTVLLKPDKTFDSFGYKAEDKYAKLCDKRQQEGWWYFQKFKMMLYKEKLSRDEKLEDAEGKIISAKTVFSAVIGHLKGCFLKDVRRHNPSIKDDDILYVLTVPVIWSEAAKQFMRESATDPSVEIRNSHLRLVFEPEAASVYCRLRKSRVIRKRNGLTSLESLEVGHKYIILDLGGGTADITTHEIIENGQLIELNYARGNKFGGERFNESFIDFLCKIFGEDIFREWRYSKHSDYIRLQRAIEGIKWDIADNDDEIIFEFPYSLAKHFENKSGKSVVEQMSRSEFRDTVEVMEDNQFLISNSLVKGFFEHILSDVTHYMKTICNTTSEIETVIIVGGLAKSSYVVRYIEVMFHQYTFIVPEDPGVAVLKGAVMLGNNPNTISGRIARYSYGIGVNANFVEKKHDDRYKFKKAGRVLCSNVFLKLIAKGQLLKYDHELTEIVCVRAAMLETKKDTVVIGLYQSTSENPSYFTEQGCTKFGSINVDSRKKVWPNEIYLKVQIVVGEAEFRFLVTDLSGRKYGTTVDFLATMDQARI